MAGADERRAGYDDLLTSMREANRDLMSSVNDKLNSHAEDSRKSLAKIDKIVALNAQKAEEIGETLKPIPEQIARLETQVEGIAHNDQVQFNLITEVKDKHRELEIELAKIPTAAPPRNLAADGQIAMASFWNGPNAKYLLLFGIALVVGLIGLAGYNISLKEVITK